MPSKRIFLACQIPENAKTEVKHILQHFMKAGFNLRLTPPEKLHITLAFLPKVEDKQLLELSEITKKAVGGFSTFWLFLGGLGAFPNLKLPRVVYLSLGGETVILGNLAKKIKTNLVDLGFDLEQEKFIPHITIARIKGYVNKVERRKLGEIIQRWGQVKPVEFTIDSLGIFESLPTSAGHVHKLLEKINLGENENFRN